MKFTLPSYLPPDFSGRTLAAAPPARFETVTQAGVAPKGYHATSIFPEYFQVEKGRWILAENSRMDCAAVLESDRSISVKELRRLEIGDRVACGRKENGEEGILVHARAFELRKNWSDKFVFRSHLTRETSFSIDYDELYALLDHERDRGFILWVLGPAVVFDQDARKAFVRLIQRGYAHGLLAGNALATHDLEGALYGTALGQEIYSKKRAALGHYNHLDTLNRIRGLGSIESAVSSGLIQDGIMHAVIDNRIPYVLAGSIRDDGPLPEVIADVCKAQDRMRDLAQKATTVIALATQLHAIATGNMVPCYHVEPGGRVRPVYFYVVDMSEFAVSKLADRGSLTVRSILTNVQDFVVTVERGLRRDP